MKEYKRITDVEVFKILEEMENEEELSMKKMYTAKMLLLLDIRHFLRKIYKESSKNKTNNVSFRRLSWVRNDVICFIL
jgi:hypothetical protein